MSVVAAPLIEQRRKLSNTSGRAAVSSPSGQGSQISLLAPRLAAIEGDEAHRGRRALRLFLEAALLDELGQELVLAPDFPLLVEKIASHLEASPSTQALLASALSELLPPR